MACGWWHGIRAGCSFFSPFLSFISSGMVVGGLEKAYDADGKAEAHTRLGHASPAASSCFHSFSFCFICLFVMNDREIPRNKFDSTLEMSFDSCEK
jgi:hypothetical protein